MKSLKARLVIFMFLCVAFISCEKEGLNSDSEDLNKASLKSSNTLKILEL